MFGMALGTALGTARSAQCSARALGPSLEDWS
jgi:hypothetical protein